MLSTVPPNCVGRAPGQPLPNYNLGDVVVMAMDNRVKRQGSARRYACEGRDEGSRKVEVSGPSAGPSAHTDLRLAD